MNRNSKQTTITLAAVLVGLIFLSGSLAFSSETRAQYASGVVFHDKNGNRVRDRGEKGLRGICVSNGREIVKTVRNGQYLIPVDDDTIIFVIKPRYWKTPLSEENLPQFYYIHKPQGSPDLQYPGVASTGPLPVSIDFPLYPQKEPKKFKAILFADPQPYNQKQIDYLAHDVVEELVGTDAAFGVTLGDIVADNLSLFSSVNRTIGLIGIPWYNVIGNHDLNVDASNVRYTDETFERIYGPSHYSFNYGQVHFIVLNDILLEVEKKQYSYHAELGAQQLTFVENDLRDVPKDQLVVLMTHICLLNVVDNAKLFSLLRDYPHTFAIAGHWHQQEHFFIDANAGWQGPEPLHALVHATVCGGWWRGQLDEVSIPHATLTDGVPNGYSIVTFDSNQYKVEYKVARRPADYQMNIFAPEVIKASQAANTEVIVNVFAGSERSVVEMRFGENGVWTPMVKFKGKDPFSLKVKEREKTFTERIAEAKGIAELNGEFQRSIDEEFGPILGQGMPEPAPTGHLWKGALPTNPPAGYHLIHVRTTDMFGHTYQDHRVLRIE